MPQTHVKQSAANDAAPSRSDIFDQPLRIVQRAGWLQLSAIVAALAGAVVWAGLLDVPIVVNGKGILLSAHGIAEVTVPNRGTVTSMLAHEGANIKTGDLIALVAQPEQRMQLTTKRAMLKEAQERLERHLDLNNRTVAAQNQADSVRRESAETRIVLLSAELIVLRERDKNLRDLSAKGLVARDQMLANEAKMHEVEIAIGAARTEIASISSQADLQLLQQERDLSTIKDQVSQLATEASELRKLLTAQTEIRSPYGGRVVEMKALAGNFIEAGAPVLTVLRDDDDDPTSGALHALVYVSPNDGKTIKPGANVLVAPSSVERAEYGMIRGRVTSVAEAPATTAGMMNLLRNDQMVKALSANGAPFMVVIDLVADTTATGYAWSSSQGPDLRLTGGTVADSQIVVSERRLLGVVIPPLARLFRAN